MKDILHFSHANGFPIGSYKTLLSYLSDDFELGSIDRLGHHADYPVTDNWDHLVLELINELETSYNKPVYAVGHSLGGVLSMIVAAQRPDLIKGLIMLDAPLLTKWEAIGVNWSKRLGLIDKITPAAKTLGRQEEWESFAGALDYFRGKRLFQAFDNRCLNDYVTYGTVEIGGGKRRLHFDAATEIQIYRTIPDNLRLSKPLVMPSAVIAGNSSDVFKKHHGNKMKRQLGMSVNWVDGSHMFPLEQPKNTAGMIKQYITEWQRI
jgi:pimeloyl-ACP methyl ester carboxylesterase